MRTLDLDGFTYTIGRLPPRRALKLENRLLRALFADPSAYALVDCGPRTLGKLPGVGVHIGDMPARNWSSGLGMEAWTCMVRLAWSRRLSTAEMTPLITTPCRATEAYQSSPSAAYDVRLRR